MKNNELFSSQMSLKPHYLQNNNYLFPMALNVFSKQYLKELSYQFSRAGHCKGMGRQSRAANAVHRCPYFLFLSFS